MNRMIAVAVALLATQVGGCGFPPKAPDPASKATVKPAVEPAANVWERSRQCAEQTEKVIKRVEAERSADVGLVGWQNHYSPKYERCFVHLSYVNRKAKELGLPVTFDELDDAFENKLLAVATGVIRAKNAEWYCSITDGVTDSNGDCAAARAYIDERMKK
jgi:hypothetical protein